MKIIAGRWTQALHGMLTDREPAVVINALNTLNEVEAENGGVKVVLNFLSLSLSLVIGEAFDCVYKYSITFLFSFFISLSINELQSIGVSSSAHFLMP